MSIPHHGNPPEDPSGKEQWIRDNKHICILPFSVHSISVEFDGQRDVKKQQTFFRNSCCCNLINHDREINAQKISPDNFLEIKKSISEGKLHTRCQVCCDSETQTGSSERTLNLMSPPASIIQKFVDHGEIENFDFRIKFSNLCNLSCRSCSPTYSSKYAQIHNITVPRELSVDISDDPVLWQDIVDSIDYYVKKFGKISLSLFGGETLIQPGAIKLIDHLTQQGICNKINLDITTNFTSLSKKMFDAIAEFDSVTLKASIDSIGKNYEYVRWPAKWDEISNNLEIFSSEPRYRRIRFIVQPLFNLNNIFYVDEILDFWQLWQNQHPQQNFYISNVMMQRPQNMTIQNLPIIYRTHLAGIIQTALKNPLFQEEKHQSLQHYLSGMLDFCQSQQVVHDQFHLYLYETARHDRTYNTQMATGNQKFYDILSDDHKNLYKTFLQELRQDLLPREQQQILLLQPL